MVEKSIDREIDTNIFLVKQNCLTSIDAPTHEQKSKMKEEFHTKENKLKNCHSTL